jgi:methylenetetrahydrofolate reductase (NADPH)
MFLKKKEALALWGYPQKLSDIFDIFVQYCRGEVNSLPWSDQTLAEESNIIREQLAYINSLGYLTINSQPAVNGVRSDHKIFGWGPKNGYVYQKVNILFVFNYALIY